jgi:hypothetical protein
MSGCARARPNLCVADTTGMSCERAGQGLVDGHFQPTCRPGGKGCVNMNAYDHQMFNGKERQHGLKFQAVALPNGLCVLAGPYMGPEHDSTILLMSKIEDELNALTAALGCLHPLCLYGDCAYADSLHIIRAVPWAHASVAVKALNNYMKPIRVVVEQLFACIDQMCPLLVAKHALRMGSSPIGLLFPVATLLHNCKTLCYGNTVAASMPGGFDELLDSMTLEQYLQ